MPPVITFVLVALAVARLSRLVVADRLTEAPRERMKAWIWARAARRATARGETKLAEPLGVSFLGCPWCVSIWIGAVAAVVTWLAGTSPWVWVPALALAYSQVTGLMAQRG